MTNLDLNLSCNNLKDEGIKHLSKIKKLQKIKYLKIDFFNTYIGENGATILLNEIKNLDLK